jgi:predicted extracellular nuclease
MFSEYIEGSSNNKALEIANATNSAVNFGLQHQKQSNGAGAWSTGLLYLEP